jgi:hypothetical protein
MIDSSDLETAAFVDARLATRKRASIHLLGSVS